jgi:GntR family transcriptional regulator, transcriptional repressor for pyruvate dehydrogenase complex
MSASGEPRGAPRGLGAALAFVRRQIDEGAWRPGDRLPNERELAQRFGLARNTLRRGLGALEAEGAITRQVGRGTFVAAAPAGAAGLEARFERASPAEIMALRLLLEPQAIELAAARATADDLVFLRDCLGRSEAASTIRGFEEWDGKLHQRIVQAARIELLCDIYAAIDAARRTAAWGKLKDRSLTPELRARYEEQHRSIVEALVQRDAERARAEMRAHLAAVQASFDLA